MASEDPTANPRRHTVPADRDWGARPMEREWVVDIRRQCQRARVPFFFKQWGGVFKTRAGRELDGRTWDQMPQSVLLPRLGS